MPRIRGLISSAVPKIGHFDDSAPVLHLCNSERLVELAALGTSCPDHFLRTKIRPLVLPFDPATETESQLIARLPQAIANYRADYAAYYDRWCIWCRAWACSLLPPTRPRPALPANSMSTPST
jgi:rhamnose utilization protein RhaD (predicted bifunctional aldolase and dehydrogenase)